MCNTIKPCDECKKECEAVMTCTHPDGTTTDLCQFCLEKSGHYCLCCGLFCSGIQSFEFDHKGYCDQCWEEIEEEFGDFDYGDEQDDEDDEEEDFAKGSLDY